MEKCRSSTALKDLEKGRDEQEGEEKKKGTGEEKENKRFGLEGRSALAEAAGVNAVAK